MSSLTTEQQGKLNLMCTHASGNRGIMNPRFLNPTLLHKFLLATDYNIDKAIKLFDGYMQMRGHNNVDNLINEDFSKVERLRQLYPRQFYHHDKFGRPVLIERLGKADFKSIFKEFSVDYLKRAMLLQYELMDRVILQTCSKMAGKEVPAMVSIIDLKGISMTDLMSTTLYELISYSIRLFQDYYPETVVKCFIINTPMMFSGFWTVIKPLFTTRTQVTISVSSNTNSEDLKKFIAPELLPTEYGGTCMDPLDSIDRGVYLFEAQLCCYYKKWDLTPEELQSYTLLNHGQYHHVPQGHNSANPYTPPQM